MYRNKRLLRFISMLLVLAMFATSQTFTLFAAEMLDDIIEAQPILENELIEPYQTEETVQAAQPIEEIEATEINLEEASVDDELEILAASSDDCILRNEYDNNSLEPTAVLPPFKCDISNKESVNMSSGGLQYSELLVDVGGETGYQISLNYSSDSSKLEDFRYARYVDEEWYYVHVLEKIEYPDGTVTSEWYEVKECATEEEARALKKELKEEGVETKHADGSVSWYDEIVIYRDCWYSWYDTTLLDTAEEQMFGLSGGWYLSIPYIDEAQKTICLPNRGKYSYYKDADSNYVVMCDGQPKISFGINKTYTAEMNGETVTSRYAVTTHDGTKYYFTSDGTILAEKDRFGKITSYTSSGELITSITDRFGRTTSISYTDSENERMITITAPDGANTYLYADIITEQYYNDTETNYILTKIVFPDGEEIVFTHDIVDADYNLYGSYDSQHFRQGFSYALLTDVEYSSGASTHYVYESAELSFSGRGRLDGYRLSERYTLCCTDAEEKTGRYTYSYEGSCTETNPNNSKKEDYTYSSIEKSYRNGIPICRKCTFNNNSVCISEEIYHNDVLKKKVETSYSSTLFPKVVTTNIYGNKTMVTKEEYSYNVYGLLNSYTSSKGEDYINPPKGTSTSNKKFYQTVYTYHTSYYLPQTVTYYIDANTKVTVTNTLINGGRSISKTEISVNGTPVSKTTYTYDEYGRVTSEKVYTDLTLNTFVEKVYTYSNGNLASVTVNNVIDNDGNSSNITTSYTYDSMGRPLTVTDANGNVTATEYDSRGRTTKVINPDGSYTEYIYDLANNITTVDHSLLDSAVYDYDSLGRLETARLSDGTILSESFYDESGRLVAEATNRGSDAASTTYYGYDAFDRITEKLVFDSFNIPMHRETYMYNDAFNNYNSLVTKIVRGDENAASITTRTYTNKHGEVVKEDIGGVVTEYAYDYVGNPIRIFYDDTTLATYTYDHNGNVTSETNALGDTRTITYDTAGRKISESDYKGNITSYTYDAAGRLLTMTAPFADGVNTVVKYYYDANGNVIKQQQSAGADNATEAVWRTVEYKYDLVNRVTDITNHVSDLSKQYTHYAYDEAGNLTHVYTGMPQEWSAVLNPDTYRLVTYSYDGRGNNTAITDAANKTEQYTYDVLGMLTSSTLRNGTAAEYTYNPLGVIADRVVTSDGTVSESMTEYTLTGAVASVTIDGEKVEYTYDKLGNVLTETEGDVVKSYTYDSRGRKSSYTLTVGGVEKSSATYSYDLLDRLISVTEGGLTTTYTYDKNGNRASQSIGGVTTTYAYNNANLVTELVNKLDGAEISSFVYTYYLDGNIRTKAETLGEVASNTVYVYDGVGRLLSETTNGVAIVYTYDANNNRTSMLNGDVVTVYTYDNNNRLLTETTGGETVEYEYDDNGNLVSAGNKTYTYNARGQQIGYAEYAEAVHTFTDGVCTLCGEPEAFMLGDADGNGIINFLDFLISMRYYVDVPDELPPQDLDGDGVAGRKDYLIFAREFAGVGEDYLPDLFAIDDLLAFADVSGNGEVGATDYLIAYSTYYEKEISECLTNGISLKTSMQAADINGDGEITEADKDIGIDYALNGNDTYPIGEMVNNTSPCDVAANTAATQATYSYNASGLRSQKTLTGIDFPITVTTNYIYNGSQIVYEADHLGETFYYYGLNRTHNSEGWIYVYNAHGDVVQLVEDGAVAVTYTYDAFGNVTSQTGIRRNHFKYCGEYFDGETGTYYLRARYYNPANGRFTQQDAWAFMDVNDPLSLNLYTYCANNPVLYVDPSGCWFEVLWDFASAGVSVVEVFVNPLDPWAWVGLIGDVADIAIPFVGGIGEAVDAANAGRKTANAISSGVDAVDNAVDAGKAIDKASDASDAIKTTNKASSTKPNQVHHFATNKSSKFTAEFEKITSKYGLDLNDDWNKKLLPHQGRHPNDYHQYVFERMRKIDDIAKGDKDKFIALFNELKKEISENPDMLYKKYWRAK